MPSSPITLPKKIIFLFSGSNAGIVSQSIFLSLSFIIEGFEVDFTTSMSSNINNVGLLLTSSSTSNVLAPLAVCHRDLLTTFTPFVVSKFDILFFAKSVFFVSKGNS